MLSCAGLLFKKVLYVPYPQQMARIMCLIYYLCKFVWFQSSSTNLTRFWPVDLVSFSLQVSFKMTWDGYHDFPKITNDRKRHVCLILAFTVIITQYQTISSISNSVRTFVAPGMIYRQLNYPSWWETDDGLSCFYYPPSANAMASTVYTFWK